MEVSHDMSDRHCFVVQFVVDAHSVRMAYLTTSVVKYVTDV